jgi:hypothetical protein
MPNPNESIFDETTISKSSATESWTATSTVKAAGKFHTKRGMVNEKAKKIHNGDIRFSFIGETVWREY